MGSSHICMTQAYGQQTPPNVFTDFEWLHYHHDEILEKYGECSVIVYKEQVIGVGPTYKGALEDAERSLSPDSPEITPVFQIIRHRNPLYIAWVKSLMRERFRKDPLP